MSRTVLISPNRPMSPRATMTLGAKIATLRKAASRRRSSNPPSPGMGTNRSNRITSCGLRTTTASRPTASPAASSERNQCQGNLLRAFEEAPGAWRGRGLTGRLGGTGKHDR